MPTGCAMVSTGTLDDVVCSGAAGARQEFIAAAPDMARTLLAVLKHDKRTRENPEAENRSPIDAVIAALTKAGVPLP